MFRKTTLMAGVCAIALGCAVLTAPPAHAAPSWSPQSSERLVKLPPNYLKKSIDNDFAKSALGQAMNQAHEDIGLKARTLGDLQQAIETADGEVLMELRHQFLAEKRAYLTMMSERNALRKKQLMTKQRLYQRMLDKMAEDKAMSEEKVEVIANQDAAFQRFESTVSEVDRKIFENTTATDSKYAMAHRKNAAALDKLMVRIQNHRMNKSVEDEEGLVLSREEFVRRMASETQGELAVLAQEETMLGYMAKLAALDAMALAEEGLDEELADSDVATAATPANSVDFFLSN